MNAALIATMANLPEQLRKTLTWDRGKELSAHAQFALATGTKVFFADRTRPGSGRRTRTPTGFSGSTFRRAQTSHDGPWKTSRQSLSRSTIGPARASGGRRPPRCSTNSYAHFHNPLLQRPIEPKQFRSRRFTHALNRFGMAGSMGRSGPLVTTPRWKASSVCCNAMSSTAIGGDP